MVPEAGVQATDTVPWPFRLSGSVYVTAAPAPVIAAAVTPVGQLISGGSATTGATGGGVGALGVSLQAAQQMAASTVSKILRISRRPLFSSSVTVQHPGTQGFWHTPTNEIERRAKEA
jgi:hypothetical protein